MLADNSSCPTTPHQLSSYTFRRMLHKLHQWSSTVLLQCCLGKSLALQWVSLSCSNSTKPFYQLKSPLCDNTSPSWPKIEAGCRTLLASPQLLCIRLNTSRHTACHAKVKRSFTAAVSCASPACLGVCREAVQLAEEAAEGQGGGVGHLP